MKETLKPRGRGVVTRKCEFLDYVADIQDASQNILEFIVV